MIVLGLDTATASSAVALAGTGAGLLRARDDPPAGAHPGHATRLLEMARGLLEQAGTGWSEIERIAVGLGPGTFTGLRVGVATARGLAQSLDAELVGVSSLQALAQGAFDGAEDSGDRLEGVLAVIDARRGEVFAAAYERGAQGAPRELSAPSPLAPELLEGLFARVRNGQGASARGWVAVGDGVLRYPEALERAGIATPAVDSPLHRIDAGAICALASAADPVGEERLLPDYCRRPDAELALEGAASGAGS
jgi:tRNA threonylcarbamoyladenosine biosynthesis protein TsaB